MAEITIIPAVILQKNGVETIQADGKKESISLHQGSLDGACAVYSTIIALMCLRQINIGDVDSENGNVDKRSFKGKFLSQLLEQRGMNLLGWNLKTMAREINNTPDFRIKAIAAKKDYIDRIYDCIHKGYPCILGVTFNPNHAHAIVCIGVEESDDFEDTPVKLLCIDPAYQMQNTAYWNCIILIPRRYDDKSDFTYVVQNQTCKIKLDDAILFSKNEIDTI